MSDRRTGRAWKSFTRLWAHPDPALRWAGRFSLAGYVILIVLFASSLRPPSDGLSISQPVVVGLILCLMAPLDVLRHVRRVQRMSGGGPAMGFPAAVRWAIGKGDLAIRAGHATLALCAAALILALPWQWHCMTAGACQAASSPTFIFLFLAGCGGRLLANGFMGGARDLARARFNRAAVLRMAAAALAAMAAVAVLFLVAGTLVVRPPSSDETMHLFGLILAMLPVVSPVFLLEQRIHTRHLRRKQLRALLAGARNGAPPPERA